MAPIKLNFIPERHLKKLENASAGAHVKIYPNGSLVFNQEIIRLYEMRDKYIKLFADPIKKAIGWQIVEGAVDIDDLGSSRKMTVNINNMALIPIKRMLNAIEYPTPEKVTPELEVKKKAKGPLDSGDIYYVILPAIEHGIKKEETEDMDDKKS